MKPRNLATLTIIVVVLTVIWMILLLANELTAGSITSLDGRIAAIEDRPTLFALNYINAGVLTLACVAMLGGYYVYCRQDNPLWALIAVLFVPIYGTFNALVYFFQVFAVPQVLALYHNPQTAALGDTWLRLALHTWPGSAAGFVNALAYAILAIPSIIFGVLLARGPYGSRLGGWLLAASGLLSVIALVGFGTGSEILAFVSPVSGLVFLLALLALSVHFLRPPTAAPSDPLLGLGA